MAGICCLVMLHSIALLPSVAGHESTARPAPLTRLAVRDLIGITLAKDPPPPRV